MDLWTLFLAGIVACVLAGTWVMGLSLRDAREALRIAEMETHEITLEAVRMRERLTAATEERAYWKMRAERFLDHAVNIAGVARGYVMEAAKPQPEPTNPFGGFGMTSIPPETDRPEDKPRT